MLRAYRRLADLPLPRLLKGSAGIALIRLFPAHSDRIRSAPFRTQHSRIGRLIRNGYLLNAVRTQDHALIRDFLADYWSSPASEEFYTGLSHRYESLFLAYHSAIVEETAKAVRPAGCPFRQVVEIGSGDGKILKHFSEHLPEIPEFHGVDLNGDQTRSNRAIYAGLPQLHFHHCDASEWLSEHMVPGSIVIANGGVLEYFTREELSGLFEKFAQAAPCIVAITESIATDHDLASEPETFPYGQEISLSHNYLAILRDAGFQLSYVFDRLTTPEESEIVGRWLQVVATNYR